MSDFFDRHGVSLVIAPKVIPTTGRCIHFDPNGADPKELMKQVYEAIEADFKFQCIGSVKKYCFRIQRRKSSDGSSAPLRFNTRNIWIDPFVNQATTVGVVKLVNSAWERAKFEVCIGDISGDFRYCITSISTSSITIWRPDFFVNIPGPKIRYFKRSKTKS